MAAEAPNTEFLIANLSLPKPLLIAGSVSSHERYIENIGADGMEVTPVQISRFAGRLAYRAAMLETLDANPTPPIGREYLYDQHGYDIRKDWTDEDEAFQRLVRGQHSSFRDTGANSITAKALPEWQASLVRMRQIQHVTGRLAAVLYPGFENGTVAYDDENAPFAARTFQPQPSDWHTMGLTENSSISEVRAAMDRQGFTHVTYDVFHAQGFDDPLHLARRLAAAGLVRSVHLAINRLDITGLHSDKAKSTAQAKQAFIRSTRSASRTLEGEILAAVANEWHDKPFYNQRNLPTVVLEDGPVRGLGVKKDHTAIIAHTRELIDNL